MIKVCKICGVEEDKHHEPSWILKPDNCVCNVFTWETEILKEIPPICNKFFGFGNVCSNCNHDRECHNG